MIVVVSGPPRSGTSMMMQMLHAGGMPVLTDHLRLPDADNPRGYLEFEPVKATMRDASWVPQAEGRAVKIIFALLQHLPPEHEYKVILMRRDLTETIASQRAMLKRSGREGAAVTDEQLHALFSRQLAETKAWLDSRTNFEVVEIEHRECLDSPDSEAAKVNRFVGGHLDERAMAGAIDPLLYRQRSM